MVIQFFEHVCFSLTRRFGHRHLDTRFIGTRLVMLEDQSLLQRYRLTILLVGLRFKLLRAVAKNRVVAVRVNQDVLGSTVCKTVHLKKFHRHNRLLRRG